MPKFQVVSSPYYCTIERRYPIKHHYRNASLDTCITIDVEWNADGYQLLNFTVYSDETKSNTITNLVSFIDFDLLTEMEDSIKEEAKIKVESWIEAEKEEQWN